MTDEAMYNNLESSHHPTREHSSNTSNDTNDYSLVEPRYQRLDTNNPMPKNTYSSLTNGVPQDYLTPVKMINGKMEAVRDDRYSVISKSTIADRPADKQTDSSSSSSSNNNSSSNLLWILLFVTCVSLTVAVIAMVLAGIALAKASERTTPAAPVPTRGPSSEVVATTTTPQIINTSTPLIKDLSAKVDRLNETLSMLHDNIMTQLSSRIVQSVNEAEVTNNKSLTRVYNELQPLLVYVAGEVVKMNKELKDLQGVVNQTSQTIDSQTGTITTLGDRVEQLEVQTTLSNGTAADSTTIKVPAISEVYTQWGRLNCSKQRVSQLYTGYAVGSGSQRRIFSGRRATDIAVYGGGANMLCLTNSPSSHSSSNGVPVTASTLYAAQYLNDSSRAEQPNPVPCSVCEVHDVSALLTIPGTNQCPHGWDKEYSGFIMAQSSKAGLISNIEKSEYICVDDAFETYTGAAPLQSNRADTVTYISKIKVDCGRGIPCSSSQYSQSQSVTCAVCSKST